MSEQIKNLENKIVQASFKYYEGDESLMTDEQFDNALDKLRELDSSNKLLQTIGWGHNNSEAKINHIGSNPVGSLKKLKYPSAIEPQTYLVSPKLDGLSVVLYITNGKVTALTRNNGIVGKDITSNFKIILENQNFKLENFSSGIFACRGEIIVPNRYAKVVREKFGVPLGVPALRNFAAGIVNRKEVCEELKYLQFLPYFIRLDSLTYYFNQVEMIEALSNSIEVPIIERVINPSLEKLQELMSVWSEQYPIDGLVLSRLETFVKNTFDYSKYENNSFAYKFESEKVDVVVGNIVWTTGASGRINPVVELQEPVELSGAKINRVTAHHAQYVKENGIGPGSIIRITRSNEVIPHILGVEKYSNPELVDNCPTCNYKLVWQGVHLVCQNPECISKSRAVLYKLFEICEIPEGLAITTIDKWLNNFLVKPQQLSNIESIFTFIPIFYQTGLKSVGVRLQMLKDNYGDHYGELLWVLECNIERKLNGGLKVSEFWYILNLPGLSKSNSQKLKMFDPQTVLVKKGYLKISEFLKGETKLPINCVEVISKTWEYWKQISNLFTIVSETESISEIAFSVAITGSLSISRNKYIEKLEQKSVEVKGIAKGTKYLICNKVSSSSKFKKAGELGISIITETDFEKILIQMKEN